MWFVAVAALLLGAVFMFRGTLGRENHRRARLIQKTSKTPIADARPGELVAIEGKAVPDAEGLIAAPGREEQVLYYSIHIEERDTAEVSGRFIRTLAHERRGVPFLIDDGSARVARIDPNAMDVNLRIQDDNMCHRPNLSELAPDVRALIEKPLTAGSTHGLKVTLLTIAPGDPIYVLGVAALVKHADPTVQYRGGSSVVVSIQGWDEEEPILAKSKEDAFFLQDLFAISLGVVPWKGIALVAAALALMAWLVLRG